MILSLVRALRKDVIIICEAIPHWRKARSAENRRHYYTHNPLDADKVDAQAQFSPFIWEGQDYIQKMLRDTDFVAESEKLVRSTRS